MLKENSKGQIKIMVSHNDLDGIGGIIVGLAKFGDSLNYYTVGYGQVSDRINDLLDYIQGEEIEPGLVTFIINDLGFDNYTAERLNNFYMNGMDVRYYDHHKTNLHRNLYPWAVVVSDGKECGTSITYKELGKPKMYGVDLTEFVDIVTDHDLWLKQIPESEDINRLFSIVGRERFIDRFVANPDVELTNFEADLVFMDVEKEDRYYKKVKFNTRIDEDAKGRTFGIAPCDRYTSNIGHRLIEEMRLDYVVMPDILGGKVSLRSREDVDVSKIAKKLGGGGHKNASGFEYDFELVKSDLTFIINSCIN